MNKIKIAHITSVHPFNDTRIFLKECKSLSKKYEVHLINKDFGGNKDDIVFIKARFLKKRFFRIISSWLIGLWYTIGKGYKIIHFHDPELIFAVPFWRLAGIKVIYDVHENYSKQLETKNYIPIFFKPLILFFIVTLEQFFSSITSKLIIVHKDLNSRLNSLNKHTIISNAPLLNYTFEYKERRREFCYVGLISEERGLLNIANSLNKLGVKFVIAGNFANKDIKNKLLKLKNVEYLGYLNQEEKIQLISNSICACCTFLPIEHHKISNPNKIYEYLNYGTPVICSNFDSYKELIPPTKEFIYYCDIVNEDEVVKKIKDIISLDQEKINIYGKQGHQFIQQKYNWELEEKKLFKLYEDLIN